MNPLTTNGMTKGILINWLKEHWKWTVFGLIAAAILWWIGQNVAAIGMAFSAIWRWLFHRGKESWLNKRILAEQQAKDKDRDQMVKDVNQAVDDASSGDKSSDQDALARGTPTGNAAADKRKVLDMLDTLDQMDKDANGPVNGLQNRDSK